MVRFLGLQLLRFPGLDTTGTNVGKSKTKTVDVYISAKFIKAFGLRVQGIGLKWEVDII